MTEDACVEGVCTKREPDCQIRDMAIESLLTACSGLRERKRHANWIVSSSRQESEIATCSTADVQHSAFGWIDKSHQLRKNPDCRSTGLGTRLKIGWANSPLGLNHTKEIENGGGTM